MRLRKKWWARTEMEENPYFIENHFEQYSKWREVFNNDNPIYLELGCGWGKFLSENAANNKDINYIGIDLKDEVLVYSLRKIKEQELNNARILAMNICFIDKVFGEDEIDRIYINFCNPWPKLRQNKRRLTHSGFLKKYKGFLKPSSEIWFKTDDDGLFEDSLSYFKEEGFNIKFITYDLHQSDFTGNVMTEYEEKFSKRGIKIKFLIAQKA